jgi:hypothetical protein
MLERSRIMARFHRPGDMASGRRPMQHPCRERGTGSTVLSAAVNLFWTVGSALAMIAPVLGLMWAGPPRAVQTQEGPPGRGISLRTEVTSIWVPQALYDLARHRAGPSVGHSPFELQAYLAGNGWRAAWYALTYRGHQVNGGVAEITQIRRLTEAADHLDELQSVLATAAGRPPRFEDGDFSYANVKVIPDMMRAVEPREAITWLMAERVVGDKS